MVTAILKPPADKKQGKSCKDGIIMIPSAKSAP